MISNISYPFIKPVPEGILRPFWSVMIPTYNCAQYLVRTLESILSQDPGSDLMQIEVVDDSSTEDDPQEVVNRMGRGRIRFYQQPGNVGAAQNFTTCVKRSIGHWVHILHGDDEVLPGFYEKYRTVIEIHHSCSMVVGRSIFINEDDVWRSVSRPLQREEGLLENAQFILSIGNEIRTPSVVVLRDAYETVGGYHTALVHCSDWEMWTRVAAYGPVAYVPRPYTLYREHSGSDTSRLVHSGLDIKDAFEALKIIASRFPSPRERIEVQSLGRMWIGVDCLYKGLLLILNGQIRPAVKHLINALKVAPSILKNWRNLRKSFF